MKIQKKNWSRFQSVRFKEIIKNVTLTEFYRPCSIRDMLVLWKDKFTVWL